MFFAPLAPPELISYHDDNISLLIRRASPKDAEELVAAVQSSLSDLRSFLPWSHFPERNTIEQQRIRLQNLQKTWESKEDFAFCIFLPQSDGSLSLIILFL